MFIHSSCHARFDVDLPLKLEANAEALTAAKKACAVFGGSLSITYGPSTGQN